MNYLMAPTSKNDMIKSKILYQELLSLRKVSPCVQMTEMMKGVLFGSHNAVFTITVKYYFPSLDFVPIL